MSFKRAAGSSHDSHDVGALFRLAVDEVARSMLAQAPAIAGNRVLPGDSRDVGSAVAERRYSAVITSPPYPNRMSYVRELRPYMYWLRFLGSGREAGELDWRAIGGTWGVATGNLNAWQPRADVRVPADGFEQVVAAIGERNPLLGRYVAKYFEDLVLHVRGLRHVLLPGARLHYVVGNSKFYDVLLPTQDLYAAIFRAYGYTGVSVRTIRPRTSKRELFEYIVEAVAG